jgi:hypothetical protein
LSFERLRDRELLEPPELRLLVEPLLLELLFVEPLLLELLFVELLLPERRFDPEEEPDERLLVPRFDFVSAIFNHLVILWNL